MASVETIRELDDAAKVRAEMALTPSRRAFVLNGASPRRTRAFAAVEDTLLSDDQVLLCPVVLHHRTAYAEVVPYGGTAQTMYPRSAAAREIRDLYTYLMGLVPGGSAS